VADQGDSNEDRVLYHPNQDKASSGTILLIVVLLLLVAGGGGFLLWRLRPGRA